MAIYMYVDGVTGDVSEPSHSGWINCDSMSWGVNRVINTPVGNVKERESSTPTFSDVTITTQMDKASPTLAKMAATTTGKIVKIHLMQTGESNPECYMEYVLTNALVGNYDVSVAADGKPTEAVSFNFTKVEMKYTEFGADNKVAGNYPASYDLETGQPG